MKIGQSAVAVLAALTDPSAGFVPESFRPKMASWGRSTKKSVVTAPSALYSQWRIDGFSEDHPNYADQNNFHLEPPLPPSREMAREVADIAPLEEEGATATVGEGSYSEDGSDMDEQLPIGGEHSDDARLRALLTEARLASEQVQLRAEEERALMIDDAPPEDEQETGAEAMPPLVTDPEKIVSNLSRVQKEQVHFQVSPPDGDDKEQPSMEAEAGQMELERMPTEEEIEQAEMRERGIEEARRRWEEEEKKREESFWRDQELKQRGIQEAKRRKAEAARIRAEREEARILAEVEARKRAIEAAREMKEETGRRFYEANEKLILRQESIMKSTETAMLQRKQEKDKLFEEQYARLQQQEEAMIKSKEDAAQRVQDRARMMEEEEARMDAEEGGDIEPAAAPERPMKKQAISDFMRVIG